MQLTRQQLFSFWVCLGLIGLIVLDLWPSQGNAIAFWQSEIFLELRLPRVLSALIGGIALGWSGLMMQTLFRNPLAGPFLIGITPGATFGVALTTYLGSSLGLKWEAASDSTKPSATWPYNPSLRSGAPSLCFPSNLHSIKNSPKCIPSSW